MCTCVCLCARCDSTCVHFAFSVKALRFHLFCSYMTGLMDHPTFVRNLALVGHLHHGKTLLMDLLVQLTHKKEWNPEKEYRYTDTRKDEQVLDVCANRSFLHEPYSVILFVGGLH